MIKAPRLRYADVAATAAIVLALGGGGIAVAAGLAKNSVSSPQIRNGQVKNPDLATDAVTGKKVKKDTLTGKDVKESSLVLGDLRIDAGAASSPNATLTGALAEAATVTFKAPSQGVVLVFAQAQFRANETGTYISANILQDGGFAASLNWDAGDVDNLFDQSQSSWVALPVTKGTHTYSLQMRELGGVVDYSEYVGAQLAVQFSKTGDVSAAQG